VQIRGRARCGCHAAFFERLCSACGELARGWRICLHNRVLTGITAPLVPPIPSRRSRVCLLRAPRIRRRQERRAATNSQHGRAHRRRQRRARTIPRRLALRGRRRRRLRDSRRTRSSLALKKARSWSRGPPPKGQEVGAVQSTQSFRNSPAPPAVPALPTFPPAPSWPSPGANVPSVRWDPSDPFVPVAPVAPAPLSPAGRLRAAQAPTESALAPASPVLATPPLPPVGGVHEAGLGVIGARKFAQAGQRCARGRPGSQRSKNDSPHRLRRVH
jgi:hypothetical protein